MKIIKCPNFRKQIILRERKKSSYKPGALILVTVKQSWLSRLKFRGARRLVVSAVDTTCSGTVQTVCVLGCLAVLCYVCLGRRMTDISQHVSSSGVSWVARP